VRRLNGVHIDDEVSRSQERRGRLKMQDMLHEPIFAQEASGRKIVYNIQGKTSYSSTIRSSHDSWLVLETRQLAKLQKPLMPFPVNRSSQFPTPPSYNRHSIKHKIWNRISRHILQSATTLLLAPSTLPSQRLLILSLILLPPCCL